MENIITNQQHAKSDYMKAEETTLIGLLSVPDAQFTIPIYQRFYSWDKSHCDQLWNDILNAGNSRKIREHFLGSIVYIVEGVHSATSLKTWRMIDGQQRLATTMLILEALARRLGNSEVEGFWAEKIRSTYLQYQYAKNKHRIKLRLTQTDKESMEAIIQQRSINNMSLHIGENFEYFTGKIKDMEDNGLEVLCQGLNKLTIVQIILDPRSDNPQRIFESMNSTARKLNAADLIRNYILMNLHKDRQKRLYENYWRKIEVEFGQEEFEESFDRFMRHYLTLKTREIPKKDKIYEEFKKYAGKYAEDTNKKIDALMEDIHKFSGYYCAMALDREPDKKLKEAFRDINELDVSVARPLLLELYDDYKHNLLVRVDFEEAIRLIESYVFRRAICGRSSRSHDKIFVALGKKLETDRSLESIKKHLKELKDKQELPSDEEFKHKFSTHRHIKVKYWLRRLENHDRRAEKVKVNEYTIEHIMPRNPNEDWQRDLGSKWKDIHDRSLDSPGNITLTGYNSRYSNRSFQDKCDIDGGFKDSPLKLNSGLGKLDKWNEETINERAGRLAAMAVDVWTRS